MSSVSVSQRSLTMLARTNDGPDHVACADAATHTQSIFQDDSPGYITSTCSLFIAEIRLLIETASS